VDTNEKHCASCLGILEQKQINIAVEKVILKKILILFLVIHCYSIVFQPFFSFFQLTSQINEAGYKTDTFSLAISFPQCLVLRQVFIFQIVFLKKK